MKIRTTQQISSARTLDGRVYSAAEGAVTEIDDDDEGMVALAQSLIMSGQAEHYGDAGTVEEFAEPGPQIDATEPKDEEAAAAQVEFERLRAAAEAAGVKVDGRWGHDRLREEIANAEAAGE